MGLIASIRLPSQNRQPCSCIFNIMKKRRKQDDRKKGIDLGKWIEHGNKFPYTQ